MPGTDTSRPAIAVGPRRRSGGPPRHPGVDLPDVVLARDVPREVLDASVRAKQRRRIGRGVYLAPEAEPDPASRAREVAIARAVGLGRAVDSPHVVSHESAALVWGLPTWLVPTTTHALTTYRAGTGHDRTVTRHYVGDLATVESATIHGVRVTTLERTVVDCASTLPPLDALVVADAALRLGADPAELARLLEARRGHRGIARARELLALADDGAESAGETATRFVVLRDGLPVPQTQVEVVTRIGRFFCDLGWPEWRIMLEYDGRLKYTDTTALVREKRRHDALVEAGCTILRVTKEDLRLGTLLPRLEPHLPTPTPLTRRRHLHR